MGGEPACFNLPIEAEVFLGLGSNIDDRRAYLSRALELLREFVDIEQVSSIYESEPVGYREQPDFLNMVVRGHTTLPPVALLANIKAIERTLGRTESFRNAPRVIDIDILSYDQLVLRDGTLELPHPRMRERSFVLLPLAEIAPEFRLPGSGERVQDLIWPERLHSRAERIGKLNE